jgi:type IV pilus assembly protein PilB
MRIANDKLKELLVGPGYIAESDFEKALKDSKQKKTNLGQVLIDQGLIKDNQLGKLIAEQAGFLFVNLKKEKIAEDILRIVPELVAKNQQVIVFDKDKQGLKIAMNNPKNYEMIEWLEKKTGEKIIVYYTTSLNIREALKSYRKGIKKEFSDIIKSEVKKTKQTTARPEDLPIIRIVDTLIEYGYQNRASDIHIEPLEKKTQIRFRIDGVLHDVVSLPKYIHNLVVSRIKVLSKLRTDEHFAAQDGKFVAKSDKERFDIRVSIVPVTEGENIAMRLLSERARRFNLEDLGLLGKDLKKVEAAIKKPYGMTLATGPTGCGKTTTMYSILKILNKPKVNICTIEDPVEYDIEGVSQIQVNRKAKLTFAKGLRSIVRQDPDIIMVGEIRDEETAGIAINSAMTGHLVLSTMHANTAATNIIRLMDMGIEPFLAASSISVIIGQRLVRKTCTKCRESQEITRDKLKKLGLPERLINKFSKQEKKIRVYSGQGCKSCSQTGYLGRIGIFEVLEIDEKIKEMIMTKANTDDIEAQAIKNGMTTMVEDGMEKVLNGITTIEELLRVIHH